MNTGSSGGNSPPYYWIVVLLLLIAGAGLRLPYLTTGLPYHWFVDEYVYVNRAIQAGTGDLNPHPSPNPSGYIYTLTVVYGGYFVWGLLTGLFSNPHEFGLYYILHTGDFYLLGRYMTVLISLITLVLIYHVGAVFWNRKTGIIAMLFLAVNPLHIEKSQIAGNEVPMVMLLALCLLFCGYALNTIGQAQRRWLYMACLIIGLAAATKYNAGLYALALLVVWLFSIRDQGWFRFPLSLNVIRYSLQCFTCCLIGFLIGYPYALLDFYTFADGFLVHSQVYRQGWFGEPTDINGWLFYPVALIENVGWATGLLGFGGILLTLFRRSRHDLLLLSALIPCYLFVSDGKLVYLRFLFPLWIPFLLLAAHCLVWLYEHYNRNRKTQTAFACILILCVSLPVLQILDRWQDLQQPDVRVESAQWTAKHLPEGTRIALEYPGSSYAPHLYDLQETKQLLEQYPAYRSQIETVRVNGYNLVDLSKLLTMSNGNPMNYLQAQGVQYIVLNSLWYQRYLDFPDVKPTVTRWYRRFMSDNTPEHEIRQMGANRKQAVISVYKLDSK